MEYSLSHDVALLETYAYLIFQKIYLKIKS